MNLGMGDDFACHLATDVIVVLHLVGNLSLGSLVGDEERSQDTRQPHHVDKIGFARLADGSDELKSHAPAAFVIERQVEAEVELSGLAWVVDGDGAIEEFDEVSLQLCGVGKRLALAGLHVVAVADARGEGGLLLDGLLDIVLNPEASLAVLVAREDLQVVAGVTGTVHQGVLLQEGSRLGELPSDKQMCRMSHFAVHQSSFLTKLISSVINWRMVSKPLAVICFLSRLIWEYFS